MTATVDPGATRAWLKTAPAPLTTAQPIRANSASGSEVSTRTSWVSWTTEASAKLPSPHMAVADPPATR